MYRYFCFRFISFMLKRKRLLNSSILYGGARTFWIQKTRYEKLTKFINIFELYQVFMYNFYNFLCQIVLIFPIYIYIYNIYIYIIHQYSSKESTHFGLRVLQHSGEITQNS